MSVSIYDPIREKEVNATPEECVRVDLLHKMFTLGYPKHLIRVEVALKPSVLTHAVKDSKAPRRRLDIVCYQKSGHSFTPLLLVECKACALSNATLRQVIGYNYYLKAPFICVANAFEMRFGSLDLERVESLPSYETLLQLGMNNASQ